MKKSLVEFGVEDTTRKSKNCFITSDGCHPEIKRIMHKVLKYYFHICEHYFQFYIDQVEPIQYAEYKKGNYYNTHMDNGLTLDRDISASVILTERKKYEGGNLKFENLNNQYPEEKLGRIIVFPSALLHGVEPVTKGTRSSLVMWGRRKMKQPPAYEVEGQSHENMDNAKNKTKLAV